MNTTTALKHARAMRPSQVSAATHLYATTEWELTYLEEQLDNPLLDQAEHAKLLKERQDGEATLAQLEEKFPHVKANADDVEAPRNLSARARDGLGRDQEHDHKSSAGDAGAAGARHVSARAPAETSPHARRVPAQPAPGGKARQRRAASRAARSTVRNVGKSLSVVNDATGGWGDDVWMFILGGVGLSLLFLVLTKPKGLENLMRGGSNIARWVIDPQIDPLRPTTTGAKR
jgi:hypothetical protein